MSDDVKLFVEYHIEKEYPNTAGMFPGIGITVTIPTGYFLEGITNEASGVMYMTLRRRFPYDNSKKS